MTQYDDARYLYAIQEIPGDTASEKFKWIEKLSSGERQASGDLDQVPSELLPLIRVNTAVKKRIHQDVAWALTSDDQTIVNRAFQATWFFDGSHKHVVDDKYFRDHILPYVSLKTRTRLVKRLALTLTGRDPNYAQQIFMTVKCDYGMQQALPLLVACDENFTYRTITSDDINLPFKVAKRIFLRNPDIMVRYLRLSKSEHRNRFRDNVRTYAPLLSSLLKKRLETFVELYEIYETEPPASIELSKTRAAILLKRGTAYLTKKPLLYIDILPLDKIPETLIESMLPGLLPSISSYRTDCIMRYLEHYPEEKIAALLCKTYKDKYEEELLNVRSNVTPGLMRVLPAEERIKQARIKIEWEKNREISEDCITTYIFNYENHWTCYLPTEECIPTIKERISREPKKEDRLGLICKMIYACKVNKDDDALLDTLLYFKTRHKNEEYWVFDRMMENIIMLYDVPRLNEKIWAVLSDIIRMFYVKHGCATEEILIAMAHYKLLHSMSITEPIDMLLETQNKKYYIHLNRIINEYPQYERQCLVVCLDIIREKYNTPSWEKASKDFLYHITKAMHDFNNRNVKSCTKVERLTIKDYPWLMDAIRQAIWSMSERWCYYNDIKTILSKNEPDLCNDWYPKPKNIVISDEDMTSGAALNILKWNPQHVLNNWQEYLKVCERNYHSKKVQRFVRSTRWYKDIPIKFMEQCMVNAKKANSSSLAILAMLIRGESLTKLLDPLVPKEVEITTDHSNSRKEYDFTLSLPFVMTLCNPPVPLDFMNRLCQGDCLQIALRSLISLSRRSTLPKVISFARNLSEQRVSVRKHGIRIMFMVAPRRELIDFILLAWQKESHYSIRGVLLEKAQELFLTEQNSDTWSLFSSLILSVTLQEEIWFPKLVESQSIFDTYAAKFIQLLLDMLDNLAANGLNVKKTVKYTTLLLTTIEPVYNLLPDEFTEKLLRRYLFHNDANISKFMRYFTINSYLSSRFSDRKKFAAHMKIFADVFVSEVKCRWDVSHPGEKHYYPLNNAVLMFVKDLVAKFLSTGSPNSEVISEMLDIFSSVLTPQMDPRSYLLLTYAKQWHVKYGYQPMHYGYQLGQFGLIPELVNIFSPLFIPFMADTLDQFLQHHKDYQNIKLEVIRGLVKAATTESCFMAVTMLSPNLPKSMIFRGLVEDLQKMDHPGIKGILSNVLNEVNDSSVSSAICFDKVNDSTLSSANCFDEDDDEKRRNDISSEFYVRALRDSTP